MTSGRMVGPNKLFKIGNSKLGTKTIIFNMGPAKTCPSKKLGLCNMGCHCYAFQAEQFYKHVVPQYRKRQTRYWKTHSAEHIAAEIISIHLKGKGLDYFRFNESGDFWDQRCVKKLDCIAHLLNKHGIRTYGYTARSDLDYQDCNFIVKGSGWDGPNGRTKVLRPEEALPPTYYICPGKECGTICTACMYKGTNIAFRLHGRGINGTH